MGTKPILSIVRPTVLFTALMLMLCMVAFSPGCSAGKARQLADEAVVRLDQTQASLQEVVIKKKAVDDFITRAQAGLSAPGALEALLIMLPLETQAAVRSAVAQGQSALVAAASVSSALTTSAQSLQAVFEQQKAQLAQLKADLASKQASDDATLDVVKYALGALGGFIPAAAALAPIVGVIQRKKGVAAGAAAVTSTIAAGRDADPLFDAAFTANSTGVAAMKAALGEQSETVIQAVKDNKTK